jgi:hypothetical protein
MPTTEPQFNQLVQQLRRHGHVAEGTHGNIATVLSGRDRQEWHSQVPDRRPPLSRRRGQNQSRIFIFHEDTDICTICTADYSLAESVCLPQCRRVFHAMCWHSLINAANVLAMNPVAGRNFRV